MPDDRRTKPDPTPGEDPREIDREKTTPAAVDATEAQDGLVHPQPERDGLGTSTAGRDLDDLDDAPDVPKLRRQS